MEQLERIRTMEEKLNAALDAVSAAERALDAYRAAQPDIAALANYLASPEWKADLAADESGLLPAELRRGVLSQDGIYDLLESDAELRQTMAALAGAAEGSEDDGSGAYI